ncbi:MAG TPA: FAD-dependent oxidoreductase [Acidimicrobiales bacterium]|nr:FAD-dependent oxidoreductase [Acidimicrobiales bacterium]
MEIAVIGGGVSGLVAAHLLRRKHAVTVFEAGDYIGGHTNTVRVDTADNTYWVDTGFIVFNDRNYPLFERLLRTLGVGWQPSDMSFSVTDDHGDFEYASTGVNGIFAKRTHALQPGFYRMLNDLNRFHREASELLDDPEGDESLGAWLERKRFSRAFIDRLIVPQASSVWSADPRQMWEFPASFLAEFFDNHGMLAIRGRPKWRTVVGGSHRYVEALVAPMRDRIHVKAPVAAVTRLDDHVLVQPTGGEARRFDEVVFAVHSDQALRRLTDASGREHEILGAIPYQHNEAVLHTDRSLLPRRRRAWASWNFHLLADPPPLTTVTYYMNRLQSLRADREFCVTLNHTAAIDPSTVIQRIDYAHPVFTAAGRDAQRRHKEISGVNRTHYCGAYWGWGFHEDGVESAVRVAEMFGVGGL